MPLSTIYCDVNGNINWIIDVHATIRQTEKRLFLCVITYPISLFWVLTLSLLDTEMAFLSKHVDFDKNRAIPKFSLPQPLYHP